MTRAKPPAPPPPRLVYSDGSPHTGKRGTCLLVVLALVLSSCSGVYLSRMYEREAFYHLEGGIYVKNARNGMCFLITNSFRNVDAVWCPCDSLKNERVLIYHPQKQK